MATTYYNDIQKLYVAYFNRPADPKGLAFWETQLEGGKVKIADIAKGFAATDEYKATFSGMTNEQIVNTVYKNLFGRNAETGAGSGLEFWTARLNAKDVTIDTVVTTIANAAKNDVSPDLTILNNKIAASVAFTAALDTDAEVAGYNTTSAPNAKTWLAGITSNASLAAAIAPATLNASVAQVVAAGTPFTLTSALANLTAANKAMSTFLAAADGDDDSTTSTSVDALKGKVTTALGKTDEKVTGDYATASAGVRAALLADQQVTNQTTLKGAQDKVAEDTTAIGKVAGLATAQATLTAAGTAVTAAKTAQTTAAADLAAKVASYNVLHADAKIGVVADNGTIAGLIKLDDNGKLVLETGVTEAKNAGITAVLAASTAQEAADLAVTNATKAQTAAQINVNYLDMNATEKADLQAIAKLMTDVTVATDALPTLAQIQTQKSILEANVKAGTTTQATLDAYNTAVSKYVDFTDATKGDIAVNDLTAKLDTDTKAVKAAEKAITDLAALVKAEAAAVSNVDQAAAIQAQIDAAKAVFKSHDLVDPVTLTGTIALPGSALATAGSDIFDATQFSSTAGGATSISLFGLLGQDSLYIGTDYTLSTATSLSKGDPAVKEVFILSTNSGADTQIVLETKAFSSNSSDPEITITLTGVAAADVHLNNGIITVSH